MALGGTGRCSYGRRGMRALLAPDRTPQGGAHGEREWARGGRRRRTSWRRGVARRGAGRQVGNRGPRRRGRGVLVQGRGRPRRGDERRHRAARVKGDGRGRSALRRDSAWPPVGCRGAAATVLGCEREGGAAGDGGEGRQRQR